jgi:7-alpha-hydroxysteroid dehydrogenase
MVSVAVHKATRGFLAYHVAKGALGRLTLLMAADLGPRVRVNAIVPGVVETETMKKATEKMDPALLKALTAHIRIRRLSQPEEIATAALYLASPAAASITGTMLDIHGGYVDEIMPMIPDL